MKPTHKESKKMKKTITIERRKRNLFGWFFIVLFWIVNVIFAYSFFGSMQEQAKFINNTKDDIELAGAVIGTTLGYYMILSIWLTVALILGIFVLLTRGKKIRETREVND